MAPWKMSPVFVYESVLTARRWQTYAGRTAFLGALLVALIVVWFIRGPERDVLTRNGLAAGGEAFFVAIVGTLLVLALLAAPAYTAASICLDRARGTLAHMLVTDLTATEIVVGKLGAHGLPMFGLMLAGLPVLVLATLLGGIEAEAVVGSFVVTMAVALVGCTLALALSVWVNKAHEVLLATYVIEAIGLLALPGWILLQTNGTLGAPPEFLEIMNPFLLVLGRYGWSARAAFINYAIFAGVCAGLAAALTLIAVVTLRRAAQRQGGGKKRSWTFPRLMPFRPTIDFNPVLWREWQRRMPSRWLQGIWGIYVIACVGASITALAVGGRRTGNLAAFVNAFQFSIGLLLVSISSVASFFEERASGGLDALLVTPLPTSSIVAGKWLANLRMVVLVMILPSLVAGYLYLDLDEGMTDSEAQVALLMALMCAYGALFNSLGLALAVWVRRFGVAMSLNVAIYVVITAAPVLLLLARVGGSREVTEALACVSPWWGVGVTTFQITGNDPAGLIGWKIFWIFLYGAASLVLLAATWTTFDHCLGRVPARGALRKWR